MIYLDTHVVVWLYDGLTEKLSQQAKNLINEQVLCISPMVSLELQYLYEIDRIKDDSTTIIANLTQQIGLKVCDRSFETIVSRVIGSTWTRDPFDRIIVAQAGLANEILLSKNQTILENYAQATW